MTTEDEMAGWHHGLNGRESECTPGDGDGQGGLVCCDSWDHKESDTTERLNGTEGKHQHQCDNKWHLAPPLWSRRVSALLTYVTRAAPAELLLNGFLS